jgi:hypothetical protein
MLHHGPRFLGALLLALVAAIGIARAPATLAGVTPLWPGSRPEPGAPTGPAVPITPPPGQEGGLPLLPNSVETSISGPSGIHLAMEVAGIRDLSTSRPAIPQPPNSRWIALDVNMSNAGSENIDLIPSDFELLTTDGFYYYASAASNLPQPQFAPFTLAPGQNATETVLFAVPSQRGVQSALFEAENTTQYVIATVGSASDNS